MGATTFLREKPSETVAVGLCLSQCSLAHPRADMPENGDCSMLSTYVSEPTQRPGHRQRTSAHATGRVDHPDTAGQFAMRRGPWSRASLLAGASSPLQPCRPARTAHSAGVRRMRSVAALIYYGQLPQLLYFAASRDRKSTR